MKIQGIPGEYGFKALYKQLGCWELSKGYFMNQKEVLNCYDEAIWPVEELENGGVYIPAPEDLS